MGSGQALSQSSHPTSTEATLYAEIAAKSQLTAAVHYCQPEACLARSMRTTCHTKESSGHLHRGVELPGGLNPPPVHGGYTGVPCTVVLPCPIPAHVTMVVQLVSHVSNMYCVCLAHCTRTFVYPKHLCTYALVSSQRTPCALA